MLWLAATYVLGDVYSAQLTSQLARPARESPISKSSIAAIIFLLFLIQSTDTLQKLEYAMKYRTYQLYVERQSSSLGILEVKLILSHCSIRIIMNCRRMERKYFVDSTS